MLSAEKSLNKNLINKETKFDFQKTTEVIKLGNHSKTNNLFFKKNLDKKFYIDKKKDNFEDPSFRDSNVKVILNNFKKHRKIEDSLKTKKYFYNTGYLDNILPIYPDK